jgi:3-hydroxyisobutyrate dehydrogenase-like beta-hydroxyacid dehydrogenase
MGRPEVARARKIQFLISGDKASIQSVKPLLEKAGGAGVWDFGEDPGAANTAKLCSNYLVIAAMEAIAESVNLANRSQIDTNLWMNMLTQTYFNAPVYINYSNIILKEAFQPAAFSLRLGLKDISLVMRQANEVEANMPVAQTLRSLLEESAAEGFAEHDITAVAMTIRNKRPETIGHSL